MLQWDFRYGVQALISCCLIANLTRVFSYLLKDVSNTRSGAEASAHVS